MTFRFLVSLLVFLPPLLYSRSTQPTSPSSYVEGVASLSHFFCLVYITGLQFGIIICRTCCIRRTTLCSLTQPLLFSLSFYFRSSPFQPSLFSSRVTRSRSMQLSPTHSLFLLCLFAVTYSLQLSSSAFTYNYLSHILCRI